MGDFKVADKAFADWMAANPNGSRAIASIHALTAVIDSNDFKAGSECIRTLKDTIAHLSNKNSTFLSVQTACTIFFRYVSRINWTSAPEEMNVEVRLRAHKFCDSVLLCRDLIYAQIDGFLHDDHTVLVHGNSNVISTVLIRAAQEGKKFRVVCTESRPECDGYKMADKLIQAGIPTTLCADTAVSYVLPNVTMVLSGAEAVDEKGSIVNPAGTNQIAMCASIMNKPFYVVCESFKLMKELIFTQEDLNTLLPSTSGQTTGTLPLVDTGITYSDMFSTIQHVAPKWDYTDSKYVTLLFTDLGTFTPSAVSEQLFKLYY